MIRVLMPYGENCKIEGYTYIFMSKPRQAPRECLREKTIKGWIILIAAMVVVVHILKKVKNKKKKKREKKPPRMT